MKYIDSVHISAHLSPPGRDQLVPDQGTDGRVCKACPQEAASCVNETWIHECRGNNQYLVPEGTGGEGKRIQLRYLLKCAQ